MITLRRSIGLFEKSCPQNFGKAHEGENIGFGLIHQKSLGLQAFVADFAFTTKAGEPTRPVARGRPSAYILAAFQSSPMTFSGFAPPGGRSTEEIYPWQPPR